MKACTNPDCRQTTFKVSFGPFARDERLPMVERVLGLLVESRYGLDRKTERLPEFWNKRRELPNVCLDLHIRRFQIFEGSTDEVCGDAQLCLRNASHNSGTGSGLDTLLLNAGNNRPPYVSPANLGRGSPGAYPIDAKLKAVNC